MKMKKLVIFILIASMSISLFGCGNSSKDSEAGVEKKEETNKGAESETINIGVVTILSGERASVGEYSKEAAELYKKQVNDAGGINGQMIDIIYEDEGATEQSVINAMVKLFGRDEITSVFTTTMSSNVIAASPTIEEYGIPTVASGSSTNIPPLGNEYLWQARTSDDLAGRIIGKAAIEQLGMEKPAVIHLADSWGTGIAEHTITALNDMGVEPEIVITVNVGEKQFSTFLTQIMNSGADGIIMLAHQQESATIAMQADSMDIDIPRIGASGLASPVALQTAGEAVNGWYAVTDWTTEVDTEAGSSFVEAYRTEYDKEPDLQSAFTYDGLSIIGEAIRIAGSSDHDAVNTALAEVQDLSGVSGTFSANDNRVFGTSLFLVQVEDEIAKLKDTVSR